MCGTRHSSCVVFVILHVWYSSFITCGTRHSSRVVLVILHVWYSSFFTCGTRHSSRVVLVIVHVWYSSFITCGTRHSSRVVLVIHHVCYSSLFTCDTRHSSRVVLVILHVWYSSLFMCGTRHSSRVLLVIHHVSYSSFLSYFNDNFTRQIFEKYSHLHFHENPSNGSRVVRCRRTERQTDRTKLIVTFHNFANAPTKHTLSVCRSWYRASWYISIVKPTRCTIFRVYWISPYMFRTIFPSIIRSPRLYIEHQVYVIQVRRLLTSGHETSSISCPLASSQRNCTTYTWCCMYSLGLLMMGGKTVRTT